MRATGMTRAGMALALVAVVGACSSNKPPRSMHIGRGMTTPDEFAILPTKPIEQPPSYNALPAPTLFSGNRVDANPQADAVAALGGNPARLQRDGQLSDAALVRQTTRYGVEQDVRIDLAKEDYKFRQKNRGRILERWFQVPTYYKSYRRQELDQHKALEYYRRAGAPTPSAPPIATD